MQYAWSKGWAVNIEFTDDPHPRNTYWEMWGLPMFDLRDAAGVMMELAECRKVYGDRYIRLSAFDSSHGWESVRMSFIVNRPEHEAGFRLERQEVVGRNIRYTTHLRRRAARGRVDTLANPSGGALHCFVPAGHCSVARPRRRSFLRAATEFADGHGSPTADTVESPRGVEGRDRTRCSSNSTTN